VKLCFVWVFLIPMSLSAVLATGCSSEQGFLTDIPPQSTAGISTNEYTFQIGDRFDVKFFENSELDINVVVRPDGRVSMNLVEDILVAGMTPGELDELVTELYREKIKDPEVSIILREFAGQRIWVAGEVFNPGSMQLAGRMTAIQALFGAGGPQLTANLNSVIIFRRDDAQQATLVYKIDVERRLEGEHGEDFVLQPYDTVYIPRTAIAEVGRFIDQYVNNLMPDFIRMGINFTYPLKQNTQVRTAINSP